MFILQQIHFNYVSVFFVSTKKILDKYIESNFILLPRPKLCLGEKYCFTHVSLFVCLSVCLSAFCHRDSSKPSWPNSNIKFGRTIGYHKRKNLTKIALVEQKPRPIEFLNHHNSKSNWHSKTYVSAVSSLGNRLQFLVRRLIFEISYFAW